MRRAPSCRGWFTVLAAGLSLTCIAPVNAASFMLMPYDREEAMRVGRRSVTTEDWGGEWRVNGSAGQALTVMTPFHRLALAARNSAFQQKELAPKEVQALLRDHQGKLVFWATLRGGRADFARLYTPVLLAGDKRMKASFAQNERTALRDDDGQFTARCLYVFRPEGVDPDSTVTLQVQDPEDKVVAKFTVNLATMR